MNIQAAALENLPTLTLNKFSLEKMKPCNNQ